MSKAKLKIHQINREWCKGCGIWMVGALYAGLEFFAGYPITPSTEIAEQLSVRLPAMGNKFIQMEDEIASMCAIIGAWGACQDLKFACMQRAPIPFSGKV